MNEEIQTMPSVADLAVRQVPTALEMIQGALAQGITSESVATVRELITLRREMDADEAKRAFVRDFIALQAEIPSIKATKGVPDKHGNIKYHYAPFEEIDRQAAPICAKFGFVYTFSEGPFQQGRITKVCTLMHRGGYEKSNPYSVRIGSGPPGATECQADGSAHTYAKRGALRDALNIVTHGVDDDGDARMEGGFVTEEQANSLAKRAMDTKSDLVALLKFAGAPAFDQIRATKYAILNEMLTKKERAQKAKA